MAYIIRSFYFRSQNEVDAVKCFLAKIRGKEPTSTPQATPQVQKTTFASFPLEMPKLPEFLEDVMNGGAFPAPEELTKAEQAVLYDPQINTLVNLYRNSKNHDIALQIKERLDEIGVDF